MDLPGSCGSRLVGESSVDLSRESSNETEDQLEDFTDAEESRESPEHTSSEPITVTLLDKLRAPKRSELGSKRKVAMNLPRNRTSRKAPKTYATPKKVNAQQRVRVSWSIAEGICWQTLLYCLS